MLDKQLIRQQLRSQRKAIAGETRNYFEQQLAENLLPFIQEGRKIAAYMACGSEANLQYWLQKALTAHCQVFMPFIEEGEKRLWFTPYFPEGNVLHSQKHMGIPQYEGEKFRAEELDVILLPLVGIDRQGFRLGQGGGYYDASLAHCQNTDSPKLVGVGFSCQLIDAVPIESWDRKLHEFVSEKGTVLF